MKRILLLLLLCSGQSNPAQVDSGKYEGSRAMLLLRANNYFTLNEYGSFANSGATGQYKISADTLILTDICDKENNITRHTFYLVHDLTLNYIKTGFENYLEAMQRLKKEMGLDEKETINPGSLSKFNHFTKARVPWDFAFLTPAKLNNRFLELDKITFNPKNNLPDETINKIVAITNLTSGRKIYNAKDGFAHLMARVYVIDGFKLLRIETTPSVNNEHVNLTLVYGRK